MRTLAATLAAAAIIAAPAAHADPIPGHPNCDKRFWGLSLDGAQVRVICDGPIQADGSWMRHRVEAVPRHYVNPSSSCSTGSYSSYCTYYEGGWADEVDNDDETYPVRPDTVLPDEPGHLG